MAADGIASIFVTIFSTSRLASEVLATALGLFPEFKVLGRAEPSVEDFHWEDNRLHLALVDAGQGGAPASALTRLLLRRYPWVQVVVYNLPDCEDAIRQVIDAGAAGHVLRRATLDGLLATLRQLRVDRPQRPPAAATHRRLDMTVAGRRYRASRLCQMTLRESEILELLAQRMSNKEISRRLGISLSTVKNHVHRILEKLDVHRRRDALRRAHELGLVLAGTPPGPSPRRIWEGAQDLAGFAAMNRI